MPYFQKQRHPLEAIAMYEKAKREYEKNHCFPNLPIFEFNIEYKNLHPLAKAQYGKNNMKEYFLNEMEVESKLTSLQRSTYSEKN